MSSHAKYERLRSAVFAASTALALIAVNDSPGGNIMPFCEPATVTSTAPLVVAKFGARRATRSHRP